jgi:hypothetical protein
MARRGDGIYLRGRTWWLDFVHRGDRHIVRIGKNINRTVAKEIAQVERGRILRGEAGIGKKRKDVLFDKVTLAFLEWAKTKQAPEDCRLLCEMPSATGAFVLWAAPESDPGLRDREAQAPSGEGRSTRRRQSRARLPP